jgi:uncharacterized DUF497 family protein
LKFEWSEEKNSLNIQKHNISFEEAKEVFSDPYIFQNLIIALIILKRDGLHLA